MFAVLTAPSQPRGRKIHDPMPVVVGLEREGSWLAKGGRPDVERLQLVVTEVSLRANSVAHDDAALLDPAAPGGQLRLL